MRYAKKHPSKAEERKARFFRNLYRDLDKDFFTKEDVDNLRRDYGEAYNFYRLKKGKIKICEVCQPLYCGPPPRKEKK